MLSCPHCGQLHVRSAAFCPTTGRSLMLQSPTRSPWLFVVIALIGVNLIGAGAWLLRDGPALAVAPPTATRLLMPSAPTPTAIPTTKPTSTPKPVSSSTRLPSPSPIPPTATAVPPALPRGHIVYTCFDGSDDEICLLDVATTFTQAGARPTQLTDNTVGDFYPSLAPDGGSILFARQIYGSNYEIFRMNTDGSNITQVTFNGAQNYAPAYSPDGSRIIFTSTQGGDGQQIWLMRADGSKPQALTTGGESIDPSWSPDGRYIAFASTRSGNRQLWVMNADGSDPRQVTDLSHVGGRSAWSADGQTLVFYAGRRDDLSRRVYFIDMDDRHVWQLPFDGDSLGPSVSPDGDWVTFATLVEGDNEIFIARPDGSGLANLSQNPGSSDYQPRWGP